METASGENRGVVCGKPHLQGCSLRLCRLRTDGLTPVSKYWTYRSYAGVIDPVNWCSCVTTWLKPLSPTPGLSWGRKNEVTQGDARASLSLIAKTSSGCKACLSLWGLAKGYLCRTREMYGLGSYANRAWKACDVLVGFSPTGCTSIWITATLGYEDHLFAAVIT
jgi:hypothetical protein